VAGTGKTVLGLEFLYRGAQAGEKGILFSFEETEDRLRAAARGLGWDIDREIDRGMVEIVFIPQPDIVVERDLLMIRERVEALGARRVVIDSVSVFLHKVKDPQISREKTFQLASVIQNAQAVGLFATDIPYGSSQLSRFGVEETVVDGVILLTSSEEAFERQRYIEIYKLRNTAHSKGRHNLVIGAGGMTIFPRYSDEFAAKATPSPPKTSLRLPTGVPGLDDLLGGGLLERSVTLVSGSAGIGRPRWGSSSSSKESSGGARAVRGPRGARAEQILQTAGSAFALPAGSRQDGGSRRSSTSHEHIRANQFLAILTQDPCTRRAPAGPRQREPHIVTESAASADLRQPRTFSPTASSTLGVTSVLTLESQAMYSTDYRSPKAASRRWRTTSSCSATCIGAIRPSLAVVKTRGSQHARGTHFFEIGRGGVRIGEQVGGAVAARDQDDPWEGEPEEAMSTGPTPQAPANAQEERLRLADREHQGLRHLWQRPRGPHHQLEPGRAKDQGYAEAEVIGRDFDLLHARGRPERQARSSSLRRPRGDRVEDEGWRVRRDGSRFWADVVISRIDGDSGDPVGSSGVTRDHGASSRRTGSASSTRSLLLTSFEDVEGTISAIVGPWRRCFRSVARSFIRRRAKVPGQSSARG
jgi:KaiC/GvpD/RAD55 family RecA-like ATPase